MVVAHDEETWKLVRSLRNQGRSYEGGGWFNHVRLGFNYRWTDVQAAIGIAQLEKLDRALELRSKWPGRYAGLLTGVDGVELAPEDDADHRRSWFVYVLVLAPEIDRARVMADLRERGVDVAEYVPCIHLQTYMREQFRVQRRTLSGRRGHRRPDARAAVLPQIEPGDQEYVVESLRSALA